MDEDPRFEFVEAVLRERSDRHRTETDPRVMQRLLGKRAAVEPTTLELEKDRPKRGYNPYDTSRPAR